MKKFLITFTFFILFLEVFSQHVGVYYVGSIKQAPYGLGFTYYKNDNDIGFFNNYKYGFQFTGNYVDAYDNSGVYRIGSWGNQATGRTTQFVTRDVFSVDLGFTFKQFKLRPFIGGGLVFYNTTTEKFIEAEDVSSGLNVLGYYWIKGDITQRKETDFNLCFGTFYQTGSLLLGIGYDTNLRGTQLIAGFIF